MKATACVAAILMAAVIIVTRIFAASPSPESQSPVSPSTERLPGVDLAEGISQVTGVAISPMLGASSVGAWRYYRTPAPQRHLLPWFCHPVVWGTGFVLLSLCFLKDVFGTVAPALIKKPLDMAELFENKASALVASAAFVPWVASQMAHFSTGEQVLSTPPDLQYASMFPLHLATSSPLLLMLPLCIVAFLVVWLASHAINVLIALCPFGFIDVGLKLVKTFLLSSVFLSYLVNPYFGAFVSLLLIFLASLIAPWAFRFTVFGTFLATDTIFFWRSRRWAHPDWPHAFLARRISSIPARTLGRLSLTTEGTITFSYRPWLVLPYKRIELPAGSMAISKGIFFPSLLHSSDDTKFRTIITFPPRYRGHEITIGSYLGIDDVRDGTIIKGFKAIRAWFKETLNFGNIKVAELQSEQTAWSKPAI